MKTKKACGLYVRVSTDRQASIADGSLDTQVDILTKYTEIKSQNSDEEWFVFDVYREEGKSGKDTNRPEYQRMLQDIRANQLDVLLCTKIDRVHRSLMDFYKLHELLDKHQVTFVSLNENWDTSSPMGRFGLKLTLAVAELEREQTGMRVKEKMRWRAEQGLWNGGQVLGYKIDPDNKGILQPDADEVKLVQLIFDSYRELRSFKKTAEKINGLGYRTKSYLSRRGNFRGNNKFTKTTISHILQNPVYIGKVSLKDELFPGQHTAIIDETLWQDVNKFIKQNRVRKSKQREQNMHVFLLEGLVRCAWCGSYMTNSYSTGRNKVYFYYKCTKLDDGGTNCKMKRVSASALEEVICERIISMAKNRSLLDSILQETIKKCDDEIAYIKECINDYQQNLLPLEQKLKNIIACVEKGKGKNLPTLIDEMEKLEEQKLEIENEIFKMQRELSHLQNRYIESEVVYDSLQCFDQLWEIANPQEKKRLLRLFVYRVIWDTDKIKMGLYFDKDSHFTPSAVRDFVNQTDVGAVNRNEWLPR